MTTDQEIKFLRKRINELEEEVRRLRSMPGIYWRDSSKDYVSLNWVGEKIQKPEIDVLPPIKYRLD